MPTESHRLLAGPITIRWSWAQITTFKVLHKKVQVLNKDRDIKYEIFHPNGTLALQGFFTYLFFDEEDKAEIRNFKYEEGRTSEWPFTKDSLWRSWDSSGQLLFSVNYNNEEYLGSFTTRKRYYPNGKVRIEERLIEDEKQPMIESSLYSLSGQLLMRYFAKPTLKKEGWQYFYSISGELLEKREYKNGWRVK